VKCTPSVDQNEVNVSPRRVMTQPSGRRARQRSRAGRRAAGRGAELHRDAFRRRHDRVDLGGFARERRMAEHHARLGPRVDVLHVAHVRGDRAVADAVLVDELELIARAPDVGADAGDAEERVVRRGLAAGRADAVGVPVGAGEGARAGEGRRRERAVLRGSRRRGRPSAATRIPWCCPVRRASTDRSCSSGSTRGSPCRSRSGTS